MAKDTLLVLSGGMDSVTMLWEYADTIAAAVTFQYGSNHNRREAECAKWNCDKLGIRWYEIDLSFMGEYFESSLLSGADAIPEGTYDDSNMRSTVVPFRNGIMLSVAAGLAETLGLSNVMIANHSGDHAIYPDCRPAFIESMGAAIADGTYEHIKLLAPYTNISKAEIAMHGKKLGVDYTHTYSCYKGGERHCGKCATCVERREALLAAGINIED
ncbi:MAG: 7-cyano-7-deazaguanine synthase QueC [Bacteroides sp.]|nr:7-cyano-7-deazaguanine synthase QueC [Bacteroides sp.]